MNFKDVFNDNDILIPILQRDYVQGAVETVIVPFIESLLGKDCDLNYIYGYEEDGCFVPVDGQQRLITLWLLYLYVHSKRKQYEPFNVTLKFQSREYATEFCARISEKLSSMLVESDERALDERIRDCEWFIASWSKNETVSNMLNTLRYLHKKINDCNVDSIYNRFYGDSCPVSFAFLKMNEENGLDDDIYIKMNGRGRPLSAFENLKSWMDEKVSELPFAEEWRCSMDNRWTNLFWDNRNKTQEHPEEIDDEQLHLFCNLLYIFHVKYPQILNSKIEEKKYNEELIEYLKLESTDINNEQIVDEIFNKLSKGEMMHLVWIERLNLMPDSFFEFVFYALNSLCRYAEELNKSKLYFVDSDKTTAVYDLSMTESSATRTIPLLYAVIRYKENSKTGFYDWMRVLRNLILNIERQEKDVLPKLLTAIENLSERVAGNDIFELLCNDSDDGVYNAFSRRQLEEEKKKANPEYTVFREKFAELENLRLFAGRISVLFKLVKPDDFTIENVDNTISLLKIIFNGGNNGITNDFDDEKHYYLRRALMIYGRYGIQWGQGCYWYFCNGFEEWRKYVRNENDIPESLFRFVSEFAPRKLNSEDLLNAVRDKVEEVSRNYLKDISTGDDSTYRYHFIHHSGIWSYMSTQLVKYGDNCNNPYDIVLRRNNGNNCNHMELRTYALYLDYKYSIEMESKYEGWEGPLLWERDNTCFFFEHDSRFSDDKVYRVAIDVKFIGVDGKRNSENCYCVNAFLRPEDYDDTSELQYNQELIGSTYEGLFNELNMVADKSNYRYVNSKNLSREEVVDVTNRLLSAL
jgi:hypothetical protein